MPSPKQWDFRILAIVLGVLVAAIVVLVLVWDWDWFLPIVERRASATLGRNVTARHLHVSLGRVTRATLDDVVVAQPDGFPNKPEFAAIRHLTVKVDLWDTLFGPSLNVPLIDMNGAEATILGKPDGTMNTQFAFMKPSPNPSKRPSPPPRLGLLTIENSHVNADVVKLKAKLELDIHTTQDPIDISKDRIVVAVKGTYAGQPITGRLIAGAVLTLQDRIDPYPIDLALANGSTHVALVGTVKDPEHFAGANLKLTFAGPDMSLLYPLTGVPIPPTAAYRIVGDLKYDKPQITFKNFKGTLGGSDLEGTIKVDPTGQRPKVDAALHSNDVRLVDLGGFVGAKPGNDNANKAAHTGTETSSGHANFLPTTPINLPKLHAADVDLRYDANHIEGKDIPLDDISARILIEDGAVNVTKLDFGVGLGRLESHATLKPDGQQIRVDAEAGLQHVDLAHIMAETSSFHGRGIVGGKLALQSTANSVAGFVANGNGQLTMAMRDGGKVSALLPDIAGLEFGNALLSALGVPDKTDIQCFVAVLPLQDGVLHSQLVVLQTGETRSTLDGSINFRTDLLHLALTTRSTHFSIGSLPGPINIGGSLTSPSILPGAEVVGRAAAATALGIVFPPALIIPTIQFGVGDSKKCEVALQSNDVASAAAPASPNGNAAMRHPGPKSPAQIHRIWERRLHRIKRPR